MTRPFALLLSALSVCGCAALSKSSPLEIRYYTPEMDPPETGARSSEPRSSAPQPGSPQRPSGPPQPASSALALRLGRVSGGPQLGEQIAWRDSPVEVGFYDGSRWTERPEAYVARALDHALYGEGRGLRHVLAGAAPVLDVRVLAFEEVRTAPRRARVTLSVLLHDERNALLEQTFTREVALTGEGMDPLVRALSTALRETAAEVAAGAAFILSGQ